MSSTRRTSRHRPRSGSAPAVTLLMFLALVAPVIGSVPGASAQSFGGSNDTTYAWVFPEGDTYEGVHVEDPAGDTQLTVTAGVPGVDAPEGSADNVDLVAVQVDEIDSTLLRVRLVFADLDLDNLGANEILYGMLVQVGLQIEGATYWIRGYISPTCDAFVCTADTATGFRFAPQLRTVTQEGERVSNETAGDPPGRVVLDEDVAELLLPRRHLAAVNGPAHVALDAKVQVLGAVVESRLCSISISGSPTCTGVTDVVPGSGGSFTLTRPTAGTHVRFADTAGAGDAGNDSSDEDDPRPPSPSSSSSGLQGPIEPELRRVDVPVEDGLRLPIGVRNLDGIKRLVQPTAEILSGHVAVRMGLPEGIAVPAGQDRPFDLVLNGTDGVTVEDPLHLRITLTTLGQRVPHVDVLELVIRPLPALTPETPRIYLHASAEPGFTDTAADALTKQVDAFASTLPDDPAGNAASVEFNQICFCQSVSSFPMHGATGQDLRLDIEEPAAFTGVVDAPVDGVLELRAVLVDEETTLAHGFARFDLTQGENNIQVPMIVAEDAGAVPAGAALTVRFDPVWRPVAGVPLMELAGATEDSALRLRLQGASYLELPVLPAPVVQLGAGHLAIGLQRGFDTSQYVNPGAGTLWNVTILNQANASDDVRVSVNGLAEGWRFEVRPGQDFRLPAGGSISIGVRVVAPEDATEGDVSDVNVTVRSKLADGRSSRVTYQATVTTGVPIEEPVYAVDNETAAQLSDKESKDSPSAGALLPLLGGVLLLAFARRRRSG